MKNIEIIIGLYEWDLAVKSYRVFERWKLMYLNLPQSQ